MYVLTKKLPLGFRLVEIEREVITQLIDNDLNLIDWNFDIDSQKLTLQYLNDSQKECVKVFPFKSIGRNATSHFGGDHSLNRYMDLIEESPLSFRDVVLT